MPESKRILVLLDNGFDPDVRIQKEMEYLASKGFDVTIYSWDRESRHKDCPIQLFNGIRVVRFFIYSQYGSGLKQVFHLLKFSFACRKAIKSEPRFDYVHCSDLNGIVIGVLSGVQNRTNSKLVFDMKEFYESGSLRSIRVVIHRLVDQLQNWSDGIIYLNERQKREVSKKNLNKLVYVPNFPYKNAKIDYKKTESDKLRISFIGFVRHREQLKALIDVAKKFEKQVEVYIHGTGALYPYFYEYAKCVKNCYVTGGFSYENIYELYKHTDLSYFVYDSEDENDKTSFPTKFFEAVVSNTPMVVAENTLHGDYCKQHQLGYCISRNYEEDLEKILVEILNNRNLLSVMSKNEQLLEDSFDWENVVKNLDEIYK